MTMGNMELTLQTLLDRTLIENLFTRYYIDLDGGGPQRSANISSKMPSST